MFENNINGMCHHRSLKDYPLCGGARPTIQVSECQDVKRSMRQGVLWAGGRSTREVGGKNPISIVLRKYSGMESG